MLIKKNKTFTMIVTRHILLNDGVDDALLLVRLDVRLGVGVNVGRRRLLSLVVFHILLLRRWAAVFLLLVG